MKTDTATISSSVLIPLMSYVAEKGISLRDICDHAQVESELFSDANTRVTLDRTDRLIESALLLTHEPLLALKVGYRLGTRSCNLLQHLMIVSPNLKEAVHKHQSYSVLFTDEAAPTLTEQRGEACIQYFFDATNHTQGFLNRILITVIAQRFWLGFKSGQSFRANKIHLSFPKPEVFDIEKLEKAMGCPVLFNQGQNAIFFDSQWLYKDSLYYNRHLLELMEKECLSLKLRLGGRGVNVANRIRDALRNGKLSYRLSIEQAAEYIGVSGRTLNRYLSQEGTNFKSLLNEERIELAHGLLTETERCMEDIAQEVGYSSRRSFDRAFSLSVGYSPAQVRNQSAK